jgi:hypothetical protein
MTVAFNSTRTTNVRGTMVVTGTYAWKRGRLVGVMPKPLRLGYGVRTKR